MRLYGARGSSSAQFADGPHTLQMWRGAGRRTLQRDMKSDVPVLLYAEFTAKPGSESQVQILISGLAEKVRQEPGNTEFTVYLERENPRKFFVFEEYLDETSFEAHIGADYGAAFNRQLSSLIEEGASQLTFLTRFDPP